MHIAIDQHRNPSILFKPSWPKCHDFLSIHELCISAFDLITHSQNNTRRYLHSKQVILQTVKSVIYALALRYTLLEFVHSILACSLYLKHGKCTMIVFKNKRWTWTDGFKDVALRGNQNYQRFFCLERRKRCNSCQSQLCGFLQMTTSGRTSWIYIHKYYNSYNMQGKFSLVRTDCLCE